MHDFQIAVTWREMVVAFKFRVFESTAENFLASGLRVMVRKATKNSIFCLSLKNLMD